MLPKFHILYGLLLSLAVLFLFPQIGFVGFLIIWVSSVLIDIDHYLYFVWLKKDFNPKNAFKWFMDNNKRYNLLPKSERKKYYFGNYFLHGFEAIFILVLLFYLTKNMFILYILLGFLFHQIIDFIDLYKKNIKSYKLLSFFYSVYKNKERRLLE